MELEAALEGVLFAMGRSVERKELAMALEVTEIEVALAAENLRKSLEENGRGIQLLTLEDSYQLGTKPDCCAPLIRLAAHPKKPVLTNVVLETLAIIAYRQPITKMEISKIRGVSSDHAINKLVEYGLVREAGRLEAPGRPILFATTEEFLRRFGLPSLQDMPELSAGELAEIEADVMREAGQMTEKVEVPV